MSGSLTGHVRKRRWRDCGNGEWHEGGWEYVIELGKMAGRRRRIIKGGFRTKKLAEHALRDELRQREAGTYVDAVDLTVRQYLEERWLPWTLSGRSDPFARRHWWSTRTRRGSTSTRTSATCSSRS